MIRGILFLFLIQITCLSASKEQKLPLPRFASMRSNNINTHNGPGKQYPIKWHYRRQFLPVEIIAEFDTWRQIKDVDGAISWVHVSLLSGKRFGIVVKSIQDLKASPQDNAKIVAKLEPSCIIQIKKIQGIWIYVESRSEAGRFEGWLKNNQLWGIYPQETKL
jgi:SH3-like domain-containing protein